MRNLSLPIFAFIAATSLAIAGCVPAPSSNVEYPDEPEVVYSPRTDTNPKSRSDAELRQAMLTTHNAARRAVGSAPLVWDEALARDAARYAQQMTRTGSFQHDRQQGAAVRQGENLWKGTRDAFSYREMSGAWIDEKRFFKRGNFPNSSTSGNWSDVAHYTQIIWSSTARIGCALSSGRTDDYLVCRYGPAGNIYGRNPLKN